VFKVRCKLIAFLGDEKKFPCHFGYKVGDEFYYDGVEFKGRICPGLLAAGMPIIHGTYMLGHKYYENIMYRYRGADVKDPEMAKYDGVGYRPVSEVPGGLPENMKRMQPLPDPNAKASTGIFACGDTRILAQFLCEAVDLSDSAYAQPFYRRALSILEKIENNPGIKVDNILDKFTDFERNEISPPLKPVLLDVLMDGLTDMGYVEVRNGEAYPTGKEPPSRLKIG
jgi:uncharacterized repeat protein (TIGR04076 family)